VALSLLEKERKKTNSEKETLKAQLKSVRNTLERVSKDSVQEKAELRKECLDVKRKLKDSLDEKKRLERQLERERKT
jgi:septal ring factor EnvC (AmiA/AmiB activator)